MDIYVLGYDEDRMSFWDYHSDIKFACQNIRRHRDEGRNMSRFYVLCSKSSLQFKRMTGARFMELFDKDEYHAD